MTWVRIDDRFPSHRKALAVGPLGRDLFVCALCYANLHLTDGFIPEAAIPTLWPLPQGADLKQMLSTLLGQAPSRWSDKRAQATVTLLTAYSLDTLVLQGLLHREAGGFRIHDYHHWNRTRAEVEEISETKRQAGRIGGRRSASSRRSRPSRDGQAKSQADGKQPASTSEAECLASATMLPNPSPLKLYPPYIPPQASASTLQSPYGLSTAERARLMSLPSETSLINGRLTPHLPGRPDLTLDGYARDAFRPDCPDHAWRGRCVIPEHPGPKPIVHQCPFHSQARPDAGTTDGPTDSPAQHPEGDRSALIEERSPW